MKKRILILLVFACYLLALNPYLGPATYDDVVYFLGAESLAKGEGYLYQGKLIGDWPPSSPLCFLCPCVSVSSSVWTAKLVVLTAILISFFAIYQLLERENREEKGLSFLLFALSPIGFIFGARVMSDWLFIALAYLFLLTLYQLDKQKQLGLWHLVAGLLLGAAMLTRYAGLFLLVPLFFGAKNDRLQSITSKGLVAFVGLSLFLVLWVLPLKMAIREGDLEVRYYQSIGQLITINFSALVETYLQLWSGIDMHTHYLILFTPLFIPLILGFYKRISHSGLMYGDCWALITLIVCFLLSTKTARYLLPAAPILFTYMILGLKSLFPKRVFLPLSICWVVAFSAMDLLLLTKGNEKTYNGLNVWASPTAPIFTEAIGMIFTN